LHAEVYRAAEAGFEQTRVVSSAGKTLTFTTKGVNGSRQQIDNVAVYEKQ